MWRLKLKVEAPAFAHQCGSIRVLTTSCILSGTVSFSFSTASDVDGALVEGAGFLFDTYKEVKTVINSYVRKAQAHEVSS